MSKANRSVADLAGAAPVFAALGDETRLRLIAKLSDGTALSITKLGIGTAVTRQAVTKHLHVLANAGLVEGFRSGREQLWKIRPEQVVEAQRCLDLISRHWDDALSRLKASLEDGK